MIGYTLLDSARKGNVSDNIQILSVALNRLKNEMCHLDFPIMLNHMRKARSELPAPRNLHLNAAKHHRRNYAQTVRKHCPQFISE